MSRSWTAMKGFFTTTWGAAAGYLRGIDPGIVKAVALKIMRHLLTTSGGLLEAHGWLKHSETEQWIAAAPFLVGILLSILDAYGVKRKINNAVIVGKAEAGGATEKKAAITALKEEVKT